MSENNKKLPTLKMELTFDDEKMQFYPPYQDLQELITLLITQVLHYTTLWAKIEKIQIR